MSTILKVCSAAFAGERIEVALLPEGVALLDSKLDGNGALWFAPQTFRQFVADVKNGKYDTENNPNA